MRRRDFLHQATGTLAARIAAPYFITSAVLAAPGRRGANDRFRIGFIGSGGRAHHLMCREDLDQHGDILAVADCYLPRIEQGARLTKGSEKWNRYQDYRRMLEKEKLDVV